MKKITMMFSLLLLLAAGVNASIKTVFGGPVVTSKDKLNIQQFKVLKGSDRVEAFKKIQTLILVSDGPRVGQADQMGVTPTTKADIQSMLGTPDQITEGGFWIYNLKSNTSACKVVLGFDKTAQVIFYSIKDCQ